MAQLRCKKCGRLVEVSEETLVLEECEFCASSEKPQGETVCFDPCEQETDPTIKPLLKRIFIFLEDEEWEKADEYCEKVLDIDPENAMAYLGKLMVEFQIPRIEDLTETPKFYNRSKNYQKLFRFAKPELCERLNEIIAIESHPIEKKPEKTAKNP